MNQHAAAWLLFLVALGLALAGAYLAALFVAIACALVEISAPTPDQVDAQRRNHAHPVSRR